MREIRTGDEAPGGRRLSAAWLRVAVLATGLAVVAGLVLIGDLADSVKGPAESNTSLDATEAASLMVVVARTPGGPGEWGNFARVIGYVSEQIGRPIAVRYVPREDEASAVVRAEEADVAFLCAHMYLDLVDAEVVRGIAVPVVDGESECRMQLVVRNDNAGWAFEDLEGRSIAVSDKSSLGGQAFLLWLCGEKGVEVTDYFSAVVTGETMEENLAALIAGEVDATIVNSAQLSPERRASLSVVESSPRYGLPPVVTSTALDPAIRQSILEALLMFDADEHLPADSRIDGFVAIGSVDYAFEQVLRVQCGEHGHIR